MIQFAGLFAVIRQKDINGQLSASKIHELVHDFQWGRPDETNCQASWTHNLPGFELGSPISNVPLRCLNAGGEIKAKMMDRNGFTAKEANVLIGAHTVGLTRNVFGPSLAAPWVHGGGDNPPNGPNFDNAFHDYIANRIVENDAVSFATNQAPFTTLFPDWFQDATDPLNPLNHLDTDVVLAFPSQNLAVHPHFHVDTHDFGNNPATFMSTFRAALDKMSKLGVIVPLHSALPCEEGCTGETSIPQSDLTKIAVEVEQSVAVAEEFLAITADNRAEEIQRLVTPVRELDSF